MRHLLAKILLVLLPFQLQAKTECPVGGPWLSPANQQAIAENAVLAQLIKQDVVLLGEHHSNPLHHQWHVNLFNKIIKSGRPVVLALEAFPRHRQADLQQWMQGEFSDAEFAERSGWNEYWRYPLELYMPLFNRARETGTPLLAINASEKLVSRVRHDGWENIAPDDREGITSPARPAEPYIRRLALSYRRHGHSGLDAAADKAWFKRFVQQQLLWDRAMAQTLAEHKKTDAAPLLVAVIGSWHLADGYGVLHQLLDISPQLQVMQLVPWDSHIDCKDYKPGFADVIYLDPALRADSQN